MERTKKIFFFCYLFIASCIMYFDERLYIKIIFFGATILTDILINIRKGRVIDLRFLLKEIIALGVLTFIAYQIFSIVHRTTFI